MSFSNFKLFPFWKMLRLAVLNSCSLKELVHNIKCARNAAYKGNIVSQSDSKAVVPSSNESVVALHDNVNILDIPMSSDEFMDKVMHNSYTMEDCERVCRTISLNVGNIMSLSDIAVIDYFYSIGYSDVSDRLLSTRFNDIKWTDYSMYSATITFGSPKIRRIVHKDPMDEEVMWKGMFVFDAYIRGYNNENVLKLNKI